MTCPYCGGTRFTDPVSALRGVVPLSIKHLVPHIVQCLACQATFSDKVLTDKGRFAVQSAMANRFSV